MNKKIIKLMAGMFVLVMVVASCSTVKDEVVPLASEEMEAKDKVMNEGTMEDKSMEDKEMEDKSMEDKEMEDKMEPVLMMNEGKAAPDFELLDIDGNVYTLGDFQGEKLYLKYWASWCSICLAGLSEVDELFLQDNDFQAFTVVTPGANGEQSKEDFIEWFKGLGYDNVKVLFDMNVKFGKEIGVRAFPTSVFIGSDGVLIQALPGHKSNEEITKTAETFY